MFSINSSNTSGASSLTIEYHEYHNSGFVCGVTGVLLRMFDVLVLHLENDENEND